MSSCLFKKITSGFQFNVVYKGKINGLLCNKDNNKLSTYCQTLSFQALGPNSSCLYIAELELTNL